MAKQAKRRDVLAEFADAMTPEQYLAVRNREAA